MGCPEMLIGQLTDDPVRQTVGVHSAPLALGAVAAVRRLPQQLQRHDDGVFHVRELDGERCLPGLMQPIKEVCRIPFGARRHRRHPQR
jgi:hypothetical protein